MVTSYYPYDGYMDEYPRITTSHDECDECQQILEELLNEEIPKAIAETPPNETLGEVYILTMDDDPHMASAKF